MISSADSALMSYQWNAVKEGQAGRTSPSGMFRVQLEEPPGNRERGSIARWVVVTV